MGSKSVEHQLANLIKKAIDDLELTTTEYQAILAQAHDDGSVSSEEQQLLKQLHEMIANGTVKRVPG